MSEIIYGAYTTVEENEVVIDVNDLAEEKIAEYERRMAKKREEEREQRRRGLVDDFFAELETDDDGNPIIPTDDEGQPILPTGDDGEPLIVIDEEGQPHSIYDAPELFTGGSGEETEDFDGEGFSEDGEPVDPAAAAEAIIADANAQAEAILADAQAQADAMRSHAEAEGKEQGYNDGRNEAMRESIAEKEALENERKELRAGFEAERAEMEKDLVDVITDVVGKAFKASLTDCGEIILHLVDNALLNIASSKEFLIKVNEENHRFLSEHKDELLGKVGSDVTLDIVMDPLLRNEDCIIETDGGLFDCGIDVELDNLVKEIRMLSIQTVGNT